MSTTAFIIPAYNAAATLEATIASVRAQTDAAWRMVIVNDGSTDDTEAIARARAASDPRIRVVTQDNRGLSAARNAGFAAAMDDADVERIVFLDSDDTVDPRYTDLLRGALADHDVAPSAYGMMNEAGIDLGWTVQPAAHDGTLTRLARANAYVPPLMLRAGVLREIARAAPLFDERLRCLEDWDLWVRLAAAGARWAEPIAEPLVRYRLRPGAMSRNAGLMWSTGQMLLERWPITAADRADGRRAWTLRCAARAAASGQKSLAQDMVRTLLPGAHGPKSEDSAEDVARDLAAELPSAMRWADICGPAEDGARWGHWRTRIASAFGAMDGLHDIVDRFDELRVDWNTVADVCLGMLEEQDRLVVYGAGWNGQALLAALGRSKKRVGLAPERICWIDEAPDAAAPGAPWAQRIGSKDLDERCVVVVTPNRAEKILDRLASLGLLRIVTPARAMRAARPAPRGM